MTTWITFSICLLILPITQLFTGMFTYKTGRGYNSSRAHKSPAAHTFASRYSGRLLVRWMPLSVIATIAAIVVSFILRDNVNTLVVIMMVTMFGPQMIALIAPIIATQRVLKFNFDANGQPLTGNIEGFDVNLPPAKMSGKAKLLIALVSIAFTAGITLIVVLGFITPSITVGDSDLRISGMYGTTVRLADIEGVVLLEQSARQIGMGARIGGHSTPNTLMGNFTAGLVMAQQAGEGPTIRIDVRGDRSIFISRAEAADTRTIYQEISNALARYR